MSTTVPVPQPAPNTQPPQKVSDAIERRNNPNSPLKKGRK